MGGERSGVENIIMGIRGMKDGKGVVMGGSERNIFWWGRVDRGEGVGWIEGGRIKWGGEFGILFIIEVIIGDGGLWGWEDGVEGGMEENGEFGVGEVVGGV